MDSMNTSPLLAGDKTTESVPPSASTLKRSAVDRIGEYDITAVRKLDLFLYFLLGLFSDLEVGYTSTATFQSYIALADFNPAPGMVAGMVGGLIGILLTTFFLMKFLPGVRVITLAVITFIGGLFMWVLKSPYNNVLGIGVLTMGMTGMNLTLLPLTYYSSAYSTTLYIVGQVFASLLGSSLIKIFDIFGWGKAAHMIVLLCFPVMTCLIFFSLDRSSFVKDNTNGNGHDGDIEDSHRSINGSNSINSISSKNDEQNTNSEREGSTRLPKADMLLAITEIRLTYAPILAVLGLFLSLFITSIDTPFLSSSLSYGGKTIETIFKTADTMALTISAMTTVSSLSILTPLGKIVSSKSPHLLWIFIILGIILAMTPLFGLLANAFPPMPIGGLYTTQILFAVFMTLLLIYIPLFISHDKTLTNKYKEFQTQVGFGIILQTMTLVSALFGLFWFQHHVLEGCQANYEANYEGVTCSFFT